jgi:hypothetical protein
LFNRGRVRPSKSASLIGMIGGAVFVIIGITALIPMAGMFGIVWTLMAAVITGAHAYNFFSKRGIASWEMDIETHNESQPPDNDFEAKLHKLNRLKEEGLISEEEFKVKREEIMNEKW